MLTMSTATAATTTSQTPRPYMDGHMSNSYCYCCHAADTSAINGHWLTISYSVLPANLSLYDSAKVFAGTTCSMFDASIVTWIVKYRELFWRPITAIT